VAPVARLALSLALSRERERGSEVNTWRLLRR
jgi:hypothetical protein